MVADYIPVSIAVLDSVEYPRLTSNAKSNHAPAEAAEWEPVCKFDLVRRDNERLRDATHNVAN